MATNSLADVPVPEPFWEAQTDWLTKKPTKWLPIFRSSEHGARIGLLPEGSLVVETHEGLKGIAAGSAAEMSLLPLLELPESEAMSRIHHGLAERGLPGRLAENLPIRTMLLLALKIGSRHWEPLALQWISNWEQDPALVPGLRTTVERGLSQKTRHLARHILRTWERHEEGAAGR